MFYVVPIRKAELKIKKSIDRILNVYYNVGETTVPYGLNGGRFGLNQNFFRCSTYFNHIFWNMQTFVCGLVLLESSLNIFRWFPVIFK